MMNLICVFDAGVRQGSSLKPSEMYVSYLNELALNSLTYMALKLQRFKLVFFFNPCFYTIYEAKEFLPFLCAH
jgi:hypothetical protein